MIKLLLFCGSMNIGGTETNVVNIAKTIDRRKFNVEIYCFFSGGPLERELKANEIMYTIGNFHRVYNFDFYWNIFKMIRKQEIDILHCFGYPSIYFGILLGCLAGVKKTVVSIQAWDTWKKWHHVALDRLISPLVNLYIADGNGARQFALKQQRLDPRKIVTIYDGVALHASKKPGGNRNLKKELFLVESDPVVTVIARLDNKMKGISFFLESISIILKELPETSFMVVGDGKDRTNLENKAKQLGIYKRLTFTGFRTDLDDILNITDILVIPSVQYESVPKTLVHSMALSKAIVATKVGDICELLEHEKTGLIIEPQDPEAIANSVVKLLRNPAYAKQLGEQACAQLNTKGVTLGNSIRNLEKQYIKIDSPNKRPLFLNIYLSLIFIVSTGGFLIGTSIGRLKHEIKKWGFAKARND